MAEGLVDILGKSEVKIVLHASISVNCTYLGQGLALSRGPCAQHFSSCNQARHFLLRVGLHLYVESFFDLLNLLLLCKTLLFFIDCFRVMDQPEDILVLLGLRLLLAKQALSAQLVDRGASDGLSPVSLRRRASCLSHPLANLCIAWQRLVLVGWLHRLFRCTLVSFDLDFRRLSLLHLSIALTRRGVYQLILAALEKRKFLPTQEVLHGIRSGRERLDLLLKHICTRSPRRTWLQVPCDERPHEHIALLERIGEFDLGFLWKNVVDLGIEIRLNPAPQLQALDAAHLCKGLRLLGAGHHTPLIGQERL